VPYRICFVSFEYPHGIIIGGAGVYASRLCSELSMLGHEVHVVTCHFAKRYTTYMEKGVFVHRMPIANIPLLRFPQFTLKLGKCYKRVAKEVGGFDILHGNSLSSYSLTKSKNHTPHVVTIHHVVRRSKQLISSRKIRIGHLTGELNPLTSYIEKMTISSANRLIADSHATKKDLITFYGFDEDKIEVVHIGVSVQEYTFEASDVAELRGRFVKDSREKIVLYAPARVDEPRKDVETLLKALPYVIKECPVKCIIPGMGNLERFVKMTWELGITDSVLFLRYINEKMKKLLFSSCNVYVHAPILEGFPIAVLEAMASGKPIVATNVGGIPELVKDGENGFLVEKGDFRKLAEKLIYLLQHEEESQLIGEKNRKLIRESFNWRKTTEMTARIYGLLI